MASDERAERRSAEDVLAFYFAEGGGFTLEPHAESAALTEYLTSQGWEVVDADELARLRGALDMLADWVIGADHHPGCSGAFPPHRCKCGWDEAQAAARAALSPVDPRPEQPA